LHTLPEPVGFVAIDVSFISLRLILPAVRHWLEPGGDIVALIKPQFEAGREQVGKGGIVKDPGVHRQVLDDLTAWFAGEGLFPAGLIRSPIEGSEGNVEFLIWLTPGRPADRDLSQTIANITAA
jgi:23S rRNA (cytidine1920-2'-O)/16S rRNA (cytidine1409-2'-O)-methyltransferase